MSKRAPEIDDGSGSWAATGMSDQPKQTTAADVAGWFKRAGYVPAEEVLRAFSDTVNDGRKFLDRLKSEKDFDAALERAQRAGAGLCEALPDLIFLAQLYGWQASWIATLKDLDGALSAATGLGARPTPKHGKESVKWDFHAAALLDIMKAEVTKGHKITTTKQIAILCDALDAIEPRKQHFEENVKPTLRRRRIIRPKKVQSDRS